VNDTELSILLWRLSRLIRTGHDGVAMDLIEEEIANLRRREPRRAATGVM
jgi:hypothetical protein